jgi:cytochrome c oxidase assembly protein subunit 15
VALSHRFAAAALTVVVASLAFAAYRRRRAYPELFQVYAAAFVLIVLQALAGGAVVLTRLELWTTLAHAGIMALLFVCLADACRQVQVRPVPAPSGRRMLAAASSGLGR